MSFLHTKKHLDRGDTVAVECSHQVNVLVMTDNDFNNYKNNRGFNYHGGFFSHFPAHVTVPNTGSWNIVIALPPGRKANISHSIRIIPA
ncbi:DUF1883 domain-containing protein [Yersinia hibernica]|uniref:DUF1883 domain-containing protein n=1 Tax=Yersinia enterocolitica LC20 TaxID=1443113 RepID=A0A7U4K0J6_YEREN|nr:DUF1883 domain-containing protein [Yersinia hibernica]AHM72990.2 DUF1883 domain-containing protein [Yersinia hibernica]